MNDKDIIFHFYKPEELPADSSRYSHFGWEGTGSLSWDVLMYGYKNAGDAIFEKMVEAQGDFSIIDSLIYPFCFTFRHVVELSLKYLFFKYCLNDDSVKKDFLNHNHSLTEEWKEIKPILSSKRKRVGSSVCLGAIEHYIKEIESYDPQSMRMRYPVTKEIEPHNERSWLDFYNLHERLDDYYKSVMQLDYDIDCQVKTSEDEDTLKNFVSHYRASKSNVEKFLELLKSDNEEADEGKN